MNSDTFTILNEEFENDKTGEKVRGITIIIDGKLRDVIDLIIKNNAKYNNYNEVVRDAFINGLNSIVTEQRENRP